MAIRRLTVPPAWILRLKERAPGVAPGLFAI